MAESPNARKGETSETRMPQPPQQIAMLQPQQKSRKEPKGSVTFNLPAETLATESCISEVCLPPWFETLFPMLSNNDTFLAFYEYFTFIVTTLKEAFLIDLFLKWLALLKFVFLPTIICVHWSWWIFSSLVLKPAFYVCLSIASLLGVTGAIGTLFAKLIHGMDFYGDKFMATIGLLIKYIKEQWGQTSQGVLDALRKLKQWAKETLEAAVKAVKHIMTYVKDVLAMVLPEGLYAWIVQWVKVGCSVLHGMYTFSRYILIAFENIVEVIKDAWDTEKVGPQALRNESRPVEPKQKISPKELTPPKPTEPASQTSPTPASDSPKQRKP